MTIVSNPSPQRQRGSSGLVVALLLGFGAVVVCAVGLMVMASPILNCLGVAKDDKDTTHCDAALASPLAKGKLRAGLLAKEAGLFYNASNNDQSIKLATEATALDDNNFNAHTMRALAYYSQNKFDLAAPDFEKAYDLRPSDNDSLVDLINTLNKLKDYKTARAIAAKAVARDPENSSAHWALGWSAYLDGDYAVSTPELRIAADKYPNDANSQNELALSLQAEGKYDAALTFFSKTLDLKKDEEIFWTNRGALYRRMARYAEAEADFQEGLKLNRSTDALTGLARTYYLESRYPDALALAKEALTIDARNEDALLVAAEATYSQDDYLMARKYLNDLEAAYPDSKDVVYWRASIANMESDYDAALLGFRSLLGVWTDDAGIRVDIGNILLDRGEKNEAVGMFNQAIKVDPSYAFAFRSRSRALSDLQDWKGAIADASEAISLDPDSAMGYARRAYADWGALRFDDAEKDYDAAYDHGLKDQWLQEERERLLIEAKRLARAEAELAKLKQQFPDAATIAEFEQAVAELMAGDGAASE